MKFKFNQNWKSQKAGETYELPKQLANELAGKGIGEILNIPKANLEGETGAKVVSKRASKEVPNETPKSNAKPS